MGNAQEGLGNAILVLLVVLFGFAAYNVPFLLSDNTTGASTLAAVDASLGTELEVRAAEDRLLLKLQAQLKAQDDRPLSRSDKVTETEEDEETSTIFEIVRLAENRFLREKKLSGGTTTKENLTFVDHRGLVLPTLADTHCVLSDDCTQSCETQCKELASRQVCNEACGKSCRKSCKGRKKDEEAQCEHTCQKGCADQCVTTKSLSVTAESDEERGRECVHDVRLNCKRECKGQKHAEEVACQTECERQKLPKCLDEHYPACVEQCGRHLCVNGECRCPIYFAGNPMCQRPLDITAELPKTFADCAAPMTHRKFSQSNEEKNVSFVDRRHPRTASLIEEALRAAGGKKSRKRPDLEVLADFSTCAVVGSSNALVGSGRGAEIDDHTAVFRFNDAPTEGHEADVGSKTTVRVQNVMTCGWHEYNDEICLHYTGWGGNFCERETLAWWKDCKFVKLSPRMLLYVRFLFRDPQAVFMKDAATVKTLSRGRHKEVNRDTSAGFFGVALAMHLCGKVDIYGYTQGSGHYFKKIDRSKGMRKFAAKHPWALEKQCLDVVSSLNRVAKHD